ncbi:Uma2 family endonuclease [Muricomes sp. OA1]|uniref:Uma2 family endonuclease n=1 Tax=Lachnospiraceae TaxID=186803 RepID=UPI0004714142|nr:MULTISPECIES: Uma2 family endonuclease [Clostridia]MCH1974983.1 Uma2 family endonuclease [Muricomes sp. OA1]GKH33811.1 hypothetical protein CE91St64_32180 [Faecalicatena contorta]
MTIQEMKQKKKEKGYTYAQIEDAGVREYWLVDPNQKAVLVYFFEDEACPIIYPIDADIPVHIFDRKLVLKMCRIAKWAEQE